jgi:hypothetical protein
MPKLYTSDLRRQWMLTHYDLIEQEGWTYEQIRQAIRKAFGLSGGISDPTIYRDKEWVKTHRAGSTRTPEADDLLKPDNFPAWRDKLFGYQTTPTQHALYYMLRCLALKEDIPEWVMKHFELPETVNDDVQLKEKLMTFILLMAPRHGKTMTMVHGLIHLYCDNPDLRVIYCQGIATTTQDINKLIMLEMEDNDTLRNWYGPFRDDNRQWSGDHGFVLAKRKRHSITPSFLPVGITSNVRSRDADILIIDDPQDETRAESEATTAKDYKKITAEFMQRREPHTPVLMVGSHVPTLFGDVFTQLEDNLDDIKTEGQEIIINKRKAHDDENCKVFSGEATEHWECLEWPEYRSWDFLMAQRGILGDELYQAVYQQENRIEGTRPFEPEKVKGTLEQGGILDPRRSWKTIPRHCLTDKCNGSLYVGLGFDPATGEGKRASYTAIMTIAGCIKCHMLYVVDYEQKRVSPDMHPGMLDAWTRKDGGFNTHLARIEINAYQKALARDPRVLEASRRNKFQIDEWRTDDRKNTPEFGIPQLSNYVREGLVSVPAATDNDLEYGKDLEKSLIRYPNKPNDIPMAMWLAAGAVWMLWDNYADLDPIYLKHRDRNVPAYMIDNPLRVDVGVWREMDDNGNNWGLEDVGA